MNIILILVLLIITLFIITVLKLWDCGISLKNSCSITLHLLKLINNCNIYLFKKYKDIDFKEAMFYLLAPLKYKSYLELIAKAAINSECTLKVILEMKDTLNRKEIIDLNKWIRLQGFKFEINKNKEIVFDLKRNKNESKKQSIKDINQVELLSTFDFRLAFNN